MKTLKQAIEQGMTIGPFNLMIKETEKAVVEYLEERLNLALSFCKNKQEETIVKNVMDMVRNGSQKV
mgnify:CR=1 FL=1